MYRKFTQLYLNDEWPGTIWHTLWRYSHNQTGHFTFVYEQFYRSLNIVREQEATVVFYLRKHYLCYRNP